jgi:glycosyltransferase involved in cell wall biosynthesis
MLPPPMSRSPDITVVIPAWNLDTELREAVASIRGQEVDCEIIVVDNCSDIPLPAIPGVRYVRTPRRTTVGGARNTGLGHVTTRYVYFQDADDLMAPGTLRRLRAELEAHPEAILANGPVYAWNPRTGALRHTFPRRWTMPISRSELARRTFLPSLQASIHCIPMGTSLVRTEAAQRSGGYPNVSWAEDTALITELIQLGPFRFTNHYCKWYRAQDERATLSTRANLSSDALVRGAQVVRRRLVFSEGSGLWEWLLLPGVCIAHALTFAQYRWWRRPERHLRHFRLRDPRRG